MSYKIAAIICTFLAAAVADIVILFTMLMAMNGYSESDATWGLAVYVVLAAVASLLMSIGALFLTGKFIGKQFGPLVSLLIAVSVCTVAGLILEIIGGLIGLGVAEFVRLNY